MCSLLYPAKSVKIVTKDNFAWFWAFFEVWKEFEDEVYSFNKWKELMKTFLEIYQFVWQLPDILNGLKLYEKIWQFATKNSVVTDPFQIWIVIRVPTADKRNSWRMCYMWWFRYKCSKDWFSTILRFISEKFIFYMGIIIIVI